MPIHLGTSQLYQQVTTLAIDQQQQPSMKCTYITEVSTGMYLVVVVID